MKENGPISSLLVSAQNTFIIGWSHVLCIHWTYWNAIVSISVHINLLETESQKLILRLCETYSCVNGVQPYVLDTFQPLYGTHIKIIHPKESIELW